MAAAYPAGETWKLVTFCRKENDGHVQLSKCIGEYSYSTLDQPVRGERYSQPSDRIRDTILPSPEQKPD